MSLKGFHVLFILLAVLCTLGFAAWCFLLGQDVAGGRAMGFFSGILGLGLACYGVWFVRKKADRLIL